MEKQSQTPNKLDYKASLKGYREMYLSMTTRELAEELKVSNAYVTQVETGAVKPSLKYLQGMCNLGFNLNTFFKVTNICD